MQATQFSEEEIVRQRLIEKGIIKPPSTPAVEGERPPMSPEMVQAYKQKLIQAGLLKPNPRPYRPRRYN